jgi:hypothetical protein
MIHTSSPQNHSKPKQPRGRHKGSKVKAIDNSQAAGKTKEMATPEIANLYAPPEICSLVRSTKIHLDHRLATMPAWALGIVNDVKATKWAN